MREMLIRQKVRRVVISCPPTVVRQWQEEMESRFGLSFIICDRSFVATCRRDRGYGINPWTTHTRFIISHALLRDETYTGPLRDWLGEFAAASMLILDEAHNAAPASGAKYAVDSQLTRIQPDYAEAHHNLAWVLFNLKDQKGQVENLRARRSAYRTSFELYNQQQKLALAQGIKQAFQVIEVEI